MNAVIFTYVYVLTHLVIVLETPRNFIGDDNLWNFLTP